MQLEAPSSLGLPWIIMSPSPKEGPLLGSLTMAFVLFVKLRIGIIRLSAFFNENKKPLSAFVEEPK
jgi:hypothetical protein